MKRTLATLLALVLFTVSVHAVDPAFFYGGWWHTQINKSLYSAKYAGQFIVVFEDSGTVTIARNTTLTNFTQFTGTWIKTGEKFTFTATRSVQNAGKVYSTTITGTGTEHALTGKLVDAHQVIGASGVTRDATSKFQVTRQVPQF